SGVTREATTEMANYPKKMTDPTEAALSAIQEALNIRDDEEQAASRPEGMGDFSAAPGEARRKAAPTTSDPFDTDAIGTRDLAAQTMRAANDDQKSIGQVLQAL